MNENSTTTDAGPLRLWADLVQAQKAVVRAREAVPLVGGNAHGWTRISIYCETRAEVDEVAAKWGVAGRWNTEGSHYVAEYKIGAAVTEAVYYGQRGEQDPAVAA